MATKAILAPGYPIDYSAQGDRTFEAISKGCILEIDKIYRHINSLDNVSDFPAAFDIKGVVADVASLPATASMFDVYLVQGEDYSLYVWVGSQWAQLAKETAQAATEESPGLVEFGSLDGALSITPSTTKVVSDTDVIDYLDAGITGSVPVGTILMWGRPIDAIPDGWFICDGTNGTPDYSGKFLYGSPPGAAQVGAVIGAEEVSFNVQSFATHQHDYKGNVSAPAHKHLLSGYTQPTTVKHNHTFTASISARAGGEHTHPATLAGSAFTYRGTAYYQDGYNGSSLGNSNSGGTITNSSTHKHNVTATYTIANLTRSHGHNYSGTTGSGSAGSGSVAIAGTTGSAGSASNVYKVKLEPKFYTLVYIMKG